MSMKNLDALEREKEQKDSLLNEVFSEPVQDDAEREPTNLPPVFSGDETINAEPEFTRVQMRKIVAEARARERAFMNDTATPEETRERELSTRESHIACQEYLEKRGTTKQLLDIFDTSNFDDFVSKVEKLDGIDTRTCGFGGRSLAPEEKPVTTKDGLMRRAFGL